MTFDLAALERRIKTLEANRGASLRFGTVTEVSEADGTARVQLPDGQDMVSMPLRIMQQRTLKDKQQCFPDVGEPVACLFAGQGFEQGVVLGAVYSPMCASPNQQSGQDYTKYEDGTEIWYDRTQHKMIAKVKGDAEIETEGSAVIQAAQTVLVNSQKSITLKAPRINLAGKLTVTDRDGRPGGGDMFGDYRIINGSLNVPDGDIIAGLTRLRQHIHAGVQAGPSTSGVPTDGGQMGNSGLTEDDERERVFSLVTDWEVGRIICMPEMLISEIERTRAQGNTRDQQGWLYLHEGILKWLHGKGKAMPDDKMHNGFQEPLWVKWNWLMQYERFREGVEILKQPDYLFSPRALSRLTGFLKKEDAFIGNGKPFNHIFPREKWEEWRAHAFQGKDVGYKLNEQDTWIQLKLLNLLDNTAFKQNGDIKPDGFQAALANTTIYALASGRTKSLNGGKWQVVIEQVAFFIHDGFNFNGDQWLGNWVCTDKTQKFAILGAPLFNSDFRKFRDETGYGCDFRTVCEPEVVRTEVFTYDIS